jgi:RND superfamily putative drug exporter
VIAVAEVDVAPDSTRPPDPARLPRGVPFFAVIAVAVLVLLVGGAGGGYQGKLSEVQKNDNSSYLPASAESTRAAGEAAAFNPAQLVPGFVVFHRDSGLTARDKDAVAAVFSRLPRVPGVAAQAVSVGVAADAPPRHRRLRR